jgi:hypothetical protein
MKCEAAFAHYLSFGVNEGRDAGEDHSIWHCESYLARYSDLSAAFGQNCEAAFDHWIDHGMGEGRNPTNVDPQNCVGAWSLATSQTCGTPTCEQTCTDTDTYTHTTPMVGAEFGASDCTIADGTTRIGASRTGDTCAVDCVGAWSLATSQTCGTPACEQTCTDTDTYTHSILKVGTGEDCVDANGNAIADGTTRTGASHTGDTCPVDCVGAWSTTSVCTPACHGLNAAANTCTDTMTYTHSTSQAGTGEDCDDAHGATSTHPNLATTRTGTECPATCSVTCGLSEGHHVKVTHNTATQHTHHRCYLDHVTQRCICTCCKDTDSNCDVAANYLY